ncbi:MarR family winged helix-turn-helix transcriptional regulator [Neptunitalea lumnitzerae]|uniref:MarR family transcriptional regulator n=1 Tax=Neptunitalea lumnitzerae TaxID=2965509 RepID=A0ABQ5MNK7_9FLAO|nr:MarR family transcriptional regulator [Neptunitalea sp. Y10]GLB50921.1 MarR family transcriptional regulator [Neptunitalea sp. Y10]
MRIEEIIKSENVDISKKVILNVMYSNSKLNETFYVALKPFDMSTEQFNVLRILRGQKGNALNMSDIQERMIAKTSNTTRLVDKLLKKELVTRRVCKDNRRKMDVSITDKGLELLKILDPLVKAHEEHFTNKLNEEELDTLNKLLEKFRS